MQKKKLGLVLVFCLFCACATRGADLTPIEWVAAARVNNALQLWQQIISLPEIEPVYRGSEAQISALVAKQNLTLPAGEWLDESLHIGIGLGSHRQLIWALWRGDDPSPDFVGASSSLFELLFSIESGNEAGTPDPVTFPEIFNRIDAEQALHLVFNKELLEQHLTQAFKASLNQGTQRLKQDCDSNLRKMNRDIKRRQLISLPEDTQFSCPFKGNYSFDSNRGAAVCDHVMPQPDFSAVAMNDIQLRADKFLKMLGDISSFSLLYDELRGQMVVRLEHTHELMIDATGEPEVASVLTWFDGLSQLAFISERFNSQLVAAPNFIVIAELMSQQGMNLEGVKEFLPPPGPVTLMSRGEFSIYSNELPEITFSGKYPDNNVVVSIIEMIKQFGIEVEEDEIFGRQLWKLPVPDMRHSFNEQQAAERAIFIRAEKDGEICISLNRELAQDSMAVAAGESLKIHLWNDVTAPVKLAYAQTMGSVARAILRLVNSFLFEHEYHECSRALAQWVGDNRNFVSKLSHEEVLDDKILSICPRKALVVSQNQQGEARLICAVHNFSAARLINYQIVDVPIPDGRWLRIRLEKGDGYSQFVADIKSPGGEK